MKVQYRFVDGDVTEIEVSQEHGEILAELDRLERNNNQTETRRHVSLDMMVDEQGAQFASAESDAFEQMHHNEMPEHLLKGLSLSQRKLLYRVLVDGETMAEIARAEGVSKQAVHERMQRALRKVYVNMK